MKTFLVLVSLALYFSPGDGEDTSGTENWWVFNCSKPLNDASLKLFLTMDECDIISVGSDCVNRLINASKLENVCSLSSDDINSTHTCRISYTYTGSVCCRLYKDGSTVSDNCSSTPMGTPTLTLSDTTSPDTSATVSTGATGSIEPTSTPSSLPTVTTETAPFGNGTNHIAGTVVPVVVGVAVVVVVILVLVCTCIYKWKQRSRHERGDDDYNDTDSVARNTNTRGSKVVKSQEVDSPFVSKDGTQALVNSQNRNGVRRKAQELRRRPMHNAQEATTDTQEDSEWLSTRTAVPFSNGLLGTGWTFQSDMQHFLDNYEPPMFDPIKLVPKHSCSTTAQDSDEGHSAYVPLLPKLKSLVRRPGSKELVTVHTSDFTITDVVQDHMQRMNQDGHETEAHVVKQVQDKVVECDSVTSVVLHDRQSCINKPDGKEKDKVVEGNELSIVVQEQQNHVKKGQEKDKVAHERQSCFKSDDRTGSCDSGKDPLKKCKFFPALFGAVVVTITCIVTLVSCVLLHPHPGSIYTHPSTVLHPSVEARKIKKKTRTLAVRYPWLDRVTPWIRALTDTPMYLWMFDLPTLQPYPLMYPLMFGPPNLQPDPLIYMYTQVYPQMFGPSNLQPAVSCAIFMLVTHTMTLVMAAIFIYMYLPNQYQTRPTYPAAHHRTSLTAEGPQVDTPPSAIGAASCRTESAVNTLTHYVSS